jgi:Plasmid pRiA4b ORF-3-like protein
VGTARREGGSEQYAWEGIELSVSTMADHVGACADPESGILYPRLIEAKGHCPPEDVGGPWGYGEFLEAIADPSHERHRELKEWFADDFNPHVVDVDRLSQHVSELAQCWSRQPVVKGRRSA